MSNRTTKILLAPNGNPSNLNEEQYYLVRTPEFKSWFGDWEKLALSKVKDPAMDEVTLANLSKDVSKVVDENGEPLVVYHGTNVPNITIFKESYDGGYWFTSDFRVAKDFAINNNFGGQPNIYTCFLSIINPYTTNLKGQFLEHSKDLVESIKYAFENSDGMIIHNALDQVESGIISNIFNCFKPTQIKLADGTNTKFDGSNPDIRFDNGGEVEKLIEQGVVDLKMYDTTPEHAKEYGLECSNPLFIQNGIGEDVFKYIDEYAKENKHDLIFGHIEQKAEPSVDAIKIMLRKNGYSTIEGNNDFYKYVKVNSKFADGGLVAPNGKKSNLTPEQYKLVRTPQFKAWFGDWENDPENASKVVDENGEPLVVFHGSKSFDITEFDLLQSKRISSGLKEFGFYFTDNKKLAEAYRDWSDLKEDEKEFIDSQIYNLNQLLNVVRNNKDYNDIEERIRILQNSKKGKIYGVFLNLKKMHSFDAKKEIDVEAWNNLRVKASYKIASNRDAMEFLKEGKFEVEKVDGIEAKNIVDAFVQTDELKKDLLSNVYLVFDSKNIKLADGSNTTFDSGNPDIRFDDGGLFSNISGENFWGNLGGGVLPICTKTKRILVPLRSEYVNEPNQIGVWGGKADEEEGESELSIINVVKREFVEETGYNGRIELIPAYVFQTPSKSFTYYNFIGLVEDEFTPILDWETKDYKWITLEELVKYENFLITDFKDGENKYYKHFGLISLLNDKNSMDLITKYADGGNQDIRFADGGLVAPNGKKSNLTPEQWKLVRTPQFKAWFGDWENDPQNASKVVDENGEPKVMYHSSDSEFTIFNPEHKSRWINQRKEKAIWFGGNNKVSSYTNNGYLYEVFLCCFNPIIVDAKDYDSWNYYYDENNNKTYDIGRIKGRFITQAKEVWWDGTANNNDGVLFLNAWDNVPLGIVCVVFEPNQIKLADGTNTTFDETNPDIRFDDGGNIFKNGGNMKKVDSGGITYGASHDNGGIPVKNASTGEMLEVEGGEGIVNKRSMASDKMVKLNGKDMSICEAVSKLNEMEGGVKFSCEDVEHSQFIEEMALGGELERGTRTEKEHIKVLQDLYAQRITPKQATEKIAKDHIKENPNYYTELAKIEKKMANGGKSSCGCSHHSTQYKYGGKTSCGCNTKKYDNGGMTSDTDRLLDKLKALKKPKDDKEDLINQTLSDARMLLDIDYKEELKNLPPNIYDLIKDVPSFNLYNLGWRCHFTTHKTWAGVCVNDDYDEDKISLGKNNIYLSIDFVRNEKNWDKRYKDVVLHEIAHAIVSAYFVERLGNQRFSEIDPMHYSTQGHGMIWKAVCSAINPSGDCDQFYRNAILAEEHKNYVYVCANCGNKKYGNSPTFAKVCNKCYKSIFVEKNNE